MRPYHARRDHDWRPTMARRQLRLPLHIVDLRPANCAACRANTSICGRAPMQCSVCLLRTPARVTKEEIIAKVWDDVAVTKDPSRNASPTFAKPLAMTTAAYYALSRARAISWCHRSTARGSPTACPTGRR